MTQPSTDPLEPVLQMTLPSPTPSSFGFPIVSFDPGSRSLLLSTWGTPEPSWWAVYGPDVWGWSALVALIVLAVLARRTFRSPQTPGRHYCRRCGYDVSDAAGPGVCPECGVSLGVARPRPGRSRLRRLAPWALALGAFVAWGAWKASDAVRLVGPIGGRTWPADILRRVFPGWPMTRITPATDSGFYVRAIALPPAADARGVEVQTRSMYNAMISPDAARLVWMDFAPGNNWTHELVVHTLASGAQRQFRVGSNADGFAMLQGFVPETGEALVLISGLVSGQNGDFTVRLVAVDMDSGVVREVGRTSAQAAAVQPSGWQLPSLAAAAGGGRWAILTLGGPDGGTLAKGGPGGPQTLHVQAPSSGLPSGERWELAADGSFNSPTTRIAADGSTQPGPAATPPWIVDMSGSGPRVLDTAGGKPAVRLNTRGAVGSMSTSAVSPDGRWCVVVMANPGPTGLITTPPQLLVWDLAGLNR